MKSYLVSCYVIISIRKKYARGGASPPPPTRPQPMVMAIIFRLIVLSIRSHEVYIGIYKNFSGKKITEKMRMYHV